MKKLKKLLSIFVSCLLICALTASFTACEGGNENEGGGSAGRETSQTDETARGEAAGGDASEAEETLNVLVGLSVRVGQAKTFGIGEAYSSDNITVMATISSDGNPADYDVTEDAVIDSGEFDNTEPGTYPIYISYTFGAKTLYTFYNVTVSSQILGTIAGLELAYEGERQFEVAAEGEAAPAIDLSKLTVSKHEGADANSALSTPLASGDYALSYSVNGGELVAVEEGAVSIPVTQRGVYSVYAEATHTSGSETFEMSGFVTFFAVDPLVSVEWNGDGTKEFEYDTDAEIGADWTYTATYASGATEQLGYADVETEGIANDNEGANTATVTYSEEQLGFDAVKNDAVKTAYSAVCEVVYTIGENPDAGQQVTDTFTVSFADTEKGWGLDKDTKLPNVTLSPDGTYGGTGSIISLVSSKNEAKATDKNATTEDGALSFSKAVQMGTYNASKAWKIDATGYDASSVVEISVYASTSGAERTIAVYDSPDAAKDGFIEGTQSRGFASSSVAYLTTWTFAGGSVYYIGSTDSAINYFRIEVNVTYVSGSGMTELFKVDFADTEKGWGEVKDTAIPGTVYVDGDGVRQTAKTDGVISLISEGQAKFKDKSATTEDGAISFTKAIQMGTIGSTKAWVIDLSEYDASAVATIKVYASTSSDNNDRTIVLNSSASKDSPIATSVPFNAGSTAYLTEWEVAGGAVYYIGSADSSINYFAFDVSVTSKSAVPSTELFKVDFADTEKGWGEVKDTAIPGTVYVDGDGVRQTAKTDGVISLISEGQAKFKDKSATTEDGAISFTKAIQMGTIGSTKAWVIDLSEYDASAVATIKVYASTSSDNNDRTIVLNSSASKDSPIATSVPFNMGSIAYLTEWEVAGGAVYYIGSADSSINYFAITVEVNS